MKFFYFLFLLSQNAFSQVPIEIPITITPKTNLLLKLGADTDVTPDAPVNIASFTLGNRYDTDANAIWKALVKFGVRLSYGTQSVSSTYDNNIVSEFDKVIIDPYLVEISDEMDDTARSYLYSTFGDYKTFFVNQLQIEDILINNLYLCFSKDTLIYFSYAGELKLLDIIASKYHGKGYEMESKEKLFNPCTKKYTGSETNIGFKDSTKNVLSFFTAIINYNNDCESVSRILVFSAMLPSLLYKEMLFKEDAIRKKLKGIRIRKEKELQKLNSF